MAVIKYYDYIEGIYVEDPEGPLVGIEWQDINDNSFRAILFIMDFSNLQYGHEIPFIYQVEGKPFGTDNWLLERRETFRITNDTLVDISDPPHQSFRRRVTKDPPEPEYVGQMDYFVDIYLKGGKYPPGLLVPMYEWLADIVADLEGQTIS